MNSSNEYYVINGTLYHADQLDELYHYGRPGMEWGKHLPGTDWWKEKTGKIKSFYESEYNRNLRNTSPNSGQYNLGPTNASTGSNAMTSYSKRARAGAGWRALGSTAKYVGKGLVKYGKKLPGHLAKEVTNIGRNVKEDVREARQRSYDSIVSALGKYINSSLDNYLGRDIKSDTPLADAMKKQTRDIVGVWKNSKEKNLFTFVNAAIQAAQYNFVAGVNDFMVKNNTKNAVDSFLKKLGIRK